MYGKSKCHDMKLGSPGEGERLDYEVVPEEFIGQQESNGGSVVEGRYEIYQIMEGGRSGKIREIWGCGELIAPAESPTSHWNISYFHLSVSDCRTEYVSIRALQSKRVSIGMVDYCFQIRTSNG